MILVLRPATVVRHSHCAALASLALFVFSSCVTATVVPKCRRIAALSMGPENAYRVSIPVESAATLAGEGDRMDVAFTIVPPLVGPVVLVQKVDGREAARWELKAGSGSGISTRCRLGATRALSTCDAAIGSLPFATAGEWSIEPLANRVLEAGLSLHTCR